MKFLGSYQMNKFIIIQKYIKLQSHNYHQDEIEGYQKQIAGIETLFESTKSHAQERSNKYDREIQNLEKQIELAKESYENDYQEQLKRQEREIEQLQESQHQELLELTSAAQLITTDASNWTEISQSLLKLANSNNLIELNKQINSVNSEENEFNLTHTLEGDMKRGIDETTRILNQNTIERLQEEINHYQSLRRQDDKCFSQLNQDVEISKQNREKCHELTIAKLKREIQHRDKNFEKYFNTISKNISLEIEKAKSDSQLGTSEKELEKFKQILIARSKSQLEVAMNDIAHIKSLIGNGANNEEDAAMTTNLSVSKVQSIERQNENLRQQIKNIQTEIAKIQRNLQIGVAELKNAKQATYDPNKSSNSSHFDQFSFV